MTGSLHLNLVSCHLKMWIGLLCEISIDLLQGFQGSIFDFLVSFFKHFSEKNYEWNGGSICWRMGKSFGWPIISKSLNKVWIGWFCWNFNWSLIGFTWKHFQFLVSFFSFKHLSKRIWWVKWWIQMLKNGKVFLLTYIKQIFE